MKMLNRKIIYALLTVVLLNASCTESGQKKMEEKTDTLESKVENKVDEVKDDYKKRQDADFTKDVIKADAEEMHLLDLAIAKGTSKAVRDLAKTMKPDHEKLEATFNAYASKNGITVDIDKSDIKSNLDDKKVGADWDKDWVDDMVDDHQKMVDKFEKNDVTDPELKSIINESLPILRKHLDMSRALQEKMKK